MRAEDRGGGWLPLGCPWPCTPGSRSRTGSLSPTWGGGGSALTTTSSSSSSSFFSYSSSNPLNDMKQAPCVQWRVTAGRKEWRNGTDVRSAGENGETPSHGKKGENIKWKKERERKERSWGKGNQFLQAWERDEGRGNGDLVNHGGWYGAP